MPVCQNQRLWMLYLVFGDMAITVDVVSKMHLFTSWT